MEEGISRCRYLDSIENAQSMAALIDNSLIRLAFSIYENRGVYALLIGSGLSRAAEIPTGWEITIDLIRRVAMAQGKEDQADWVSWYREATGKEPDYSELVGELGLSAPERRLDTAQLYRAVR